MHSKVLKIGTVLLACVCLVSFMVVSVSAAEYYWEISVPISKPTCTDNFAYVEVFTHNQTTGAVGGCVYLISAYGPTAETNQPRLSIQVTLNSISFYANPEYTYYIMCVDGGGALYNTGTATSGNSVTDYYSTNICAVKYYGFANYTANTTVNNITNCTFIYGSDNVSARLLEDIKNILSNQSNADITNAINNQTAQQNQNALDIQNNANQNAANIQANQDANTDKQIAADNANTDKQIAADKQNTDQITDGWEGADNIDDSTANDYKDTESAALGGKSDADIQNEVNSALDFDISAFDSIKVGKIHSLFDKVLAVTGGWQSLFVLSLTLGLGAFLIGRRYG